MGRLLTFPDMDSHAQDSVLQFRKDEDYPEILWASATGLGPDAIELAYLKGRLHGLQQAHDLFTKERND